MSMALVVKYGIDTKNLGGQSGHELRELNWAPAPRRRIATSHDELNY